MRKTTRLLAAVLVAAVAVGAGVLWLRSSRLPEPGSTAYEQVTGDFYRGLAALEVGLLDDARREFTSATERVPEEPASWANLGLTRLRLGELDAAGEPIARALSLASDNADLVLLAGRMEIARGRLDEGLVHLRRAVELAPQALQARFALADEVERAAGPEADAQATALLDELARLAPENPAVHVERARLAAKRRDAAALADAIDKLTPAAAAWPPRAVEQFDALRMAASAGDLQRAQLTTAFLRNVLASVPSFIESLSAIRTPTELIAEPLETFVRMAAPSAMPSPPDLGLTFQEELVDSDVAPLSVLLAVPSAEGGTSIVAGMLPGIVSVSGPPIRLPFPTRPGTDMVPSANALLAIDWNNDFRGDIVAAGTGGVRLFLQDANGAFADRTPAGGAASECVCRGVWAADVEMDGDLDIIAGQDQGRPLVLRNNGDGTWLEQAMFEGVTDVRGFAWADLDRDGDPDALFLDGTMTLRAFANRQAGDFVALRDFPLLTGVLAMAVADINGDGSFDIVYVDEAGSFHRLSRQGGGWNGEIIASWDAFRGPGPFGHLTVIDLDNNGALDLVASNQTDARIWLADERQELHVLDVSLPDPVFSVGDLDNDGHVDLMVVRSLPTGETRAVRMLTRGTRDYHWKVIRPRAQTTAGDQRINSFGVGGDIEVRSGLLLQKQVLTGGPVHIGLGDRTTIDVARIVWPNGVAQAEFGTAVDDALVAEQRLKGSCPWVFAWDGTKMAFVTDFLWRSPLGLRINAQDTAGVVQTEDWVKIAGDQLVPRNGVYDVRITAELWETHFFDHVSLMVVDHPASADVFVDERFSAAAPPEYKVHVVENRRPLAGARDHRGADVSGTVAAKDGRYLATFAKGAYQGIAEEHYVELDVPETAAGTRRVLLASGWIYPTDSSINVAIAQGGRVAPKGLSLEAQAPDGSWRVVNADLGFPAGKMKTLVIDLAAAAGARRLRLRTNLEIYWDALELATPVDTPIRTTRLPAQRAELRFRGFSVTSSERESTPETPDYGRLATTSQRWRDLIGYHTRFGDVAELIETVDDRYVIMNAGDELQVSFAEQPPPADGWRRDFVLIGDGWEKDGDYNTGFSQTVLPLPSHDKPAYGAGVTSVELEDDPVYQRHKDDWQRYHTRYVTPRRFVDGLRAATGD